MVEYKEILETLPSEAFQQANTGKFASKLDRNERCAILALVRNGIKREVLSRIFEIDKRTVAHIVNESGPHYKEIRKEYQLEGHDEFCAKYLTPTIMERVTGGLEAAITAAKAEAALPRASSYAAKMRGVHSVQPEQCSYVHQIEIGYLSKESLDTKDGGKYPEWDGWYYRDLTSEDKDTWFHNGVDSVKTSVTCFDMAVANLMDD
jgi:hypothetical protein